MPATSTVTPSGISYVDYVDGGTKWAINSFTYSFPASASFYVGFNGGSYGSGEQNSGFQPFNGVQQAATASILKMYSAVANVSFTQITETSTQSADFRYAESSQPSTAWGYYPSASPEGGDAWFSSAGLYNNPLVGNYAWLTIIHETGHLLGLKHPQDVMGSFAAVPVSVDSLEYTVMSYRSYIGASTTQGLTNATWSFPTTLMVYDIASLQYMYGANYSTNSSDTVYKWNPGTGQETINGIAQTAPAGNTVFMTLWDGGGNDTYDFSNYTTNLSVNLQPGGWTTTSTAQLANLGNGHTAIGNIANAYLYNNNPASLIENAVGGSGSDSITGNAADNKLTGGAGNDTLDGVSGIDTAVYSGSSSAYQVTQNADGSWKVADLRAGSPDGTDTLKNIDFLQFSDTTVAVGTVPTPPLVPAPVVGSISPDSASVGDNITNANVLTLTGTAQANSTVRVYDGTTLLGSVVANVSGSWSFATSALADGNHSFSATATDGSGSTSAASGVLAVIVDTAAPVGPTISLQSVDSGMVGDGITNVNVISLTGMAEVNSTIKVYDGTTLLGSAKANAEGVWNFVADLSDDQAAAPAGTAGQGAAADAGPANQNQAWGFTTGPLPDGVHNLTATSTDAAGNLSPTSAVLTVTIDTAAPVAPTVASFSTDSGVVGDRITNDNTLTLAGTAEANATVKVYDGAMLLGSAVASGTGAWSYTTVALGNGGHNLAATATDAAGNTSPVSSAFAVTIDTAAPVAPTIASFSTDSGVVGDRITNDNTLTLAGTAEASATVKVYDGSMLLGSAVASGTGAWNYTTAALGNGGHSLTVTATDAAGNTSLASSVFAITIDTAAPVAPTIASFSTDSGVVGDGITNDNTLTLAGTTETNATVKIYDGATLLGSAVASGTGAWSYTTVGLGNGGHNLTATATDAAGNTSLASSALAVTIDTAAPVAPILTGDTALGANQLLISGTAEANTKVSVLDGTMVLGTTTTNASGAWNFTTNVLSNGAHAFTATATDTAGNASSASQLLAPIVGAAVIESNGSISLSQAGTKYYLDNGSGAAPLSLKFGGTDFVTGYFGGWAPIGVEKTATGYEVAWKDASTGLFTAWNTDNNGNYVSNVSGLTSYVSGTSAALESFETSLHQDLNGDGQIGFAATVIESDGSTSLSQAGTKYYLDNGSGAGSVSLKFGGADFVTGYFGGWAPIGVEKTATGYEVAWKDASTGLFTAWNTDSNGNYVSNVSGLTGYVSGTNAALLSFETSLHQDLNGDGQIGFAATVIESNGSISLTQGGNNYYLDDNTGVGPSLKFGGADFVTGYFGSWAPVGAEKTATGYEVAWKDASTGLYTAWNTDSNGNYLANVSGLTGYVSGTSAALESFETSLHQDLNKDGYVGLVLNGSVGGQTLNASGTPTTLIGGPNDVLAGGAAADTFVFPTNFGANTVKNFTPGADALLFSHDMFADIATVLGDAQQVGSNVVIAHDPLNVVTLQNMQLSSLHASDIHII